MTKYDKNTEEKEARLFTKSDYDRLRDGMKSYEMKRIHGKLYGPFEQYLSEKNIVRISETGMSIVWPLGYKEHCDMKENMDGFDRAEQERAFMQFPELREEWNAKKATLFKDRASMKI